MKTHDIIIVGAGHNGLVAAAYLAKAGLKPLVLERRDTVGGIAVTEEIHPGFRCPTVAHTAAPLTGKIAQELGLEKHGLSWLSPAVRVFAPDRAGGSFAIFEDAAKTAERLRARSA